MCGRSLSVWEESVCGSGFCVTVGFQDIIEALMALLTYLLTYTLFVLL